VNDQPAVLGYDEVKPHGEMVTPTAVTKAQTASQLSLLSFFTAMSFKFGLNIQKKPQKPLGKPAFGTGKPAFGDDSDEDEPKKADNALEVGGLPLNQAEASQGSTDSSGPPKKPALKSKTNLPISQYGDLSSHRSHLKNAEEAVALDPSIYDYDAAYDAIHARDAAKKAAARVEAEERKAKYMDNLLASAELRKKDILRAKDKQLQREREAEGDEFADKEKFVTGAYKQQQEEVRQAEAEEKRRQELEEKKKKEMGMQGFYKTVMDQQEQRYQEAVAATAEAQRTGVVIETEKEKTDLELAAEMKAKGTDVLLNDDGEIVDKRQLLSAGLNIIKKPKPVTKPATASRVTASQPSYQSKTASQQAMRERQTRMLEAQLEQSAKRAADDEAEEKRKIEHLAKSRKTDSEIGSAKERYLARKKAAAEAAAKKDAA
jgi:coiled-coil domain-containing protein 55